MTKAHFITLKIKDLEEIFGCIILKNVTSLGLDTASNTGWCIAKTDNENVHLSIGFINVDVKNIKDKYLRNQMRYDAVYTNLKGLIKSEYRIVIENVYYGRNANTLIVLSRLGAIAWTIAREKKCKVIKWRLACQARTVLGLNGTAKKPIIVETINRWLNLKIENDDEIDAIVLAFNGLTEKEPKPIVRKPRKRRKKK